MVDEIDSLLLFVSLPVSLSAWILDESPRSNSELDWGSSFLLTGWVKDLVIGAECFILPLGVDFPFRN